MLEEERHQFGTQILETKLSWGWARHLKVWRRDSNEDGITWDQLQEIKNEMLGEDVCAIEFYPPSDEVVNSVAIRHLWEIPASVIVPPFGRGRELL